jgi:FKBP-type peptidyl-prolyl cis-trans isomerase FkpA
LNYNLLNYNKPKKLLSLLAAALLLSACAEPTETKETTSPGPDLDDADQKLAYVIGASAGKSMITNLKTLEGTNITVDTETLIKGFVDGINGSAKLDDAAQLAVMEEFRTRMTAAMEQKRNIEMEAQSKAGAAYLSQNKTKADVTALESGLQYQVLAAGSGKSPGPTDRVTVHYRGTLIDGTQFDSSYDRGEPATFGVNGVIKGWTEALQLMKEGAKWQLTIPAELAYGQSARPTIPANSVLLFEVELLEIAQ